MTNTKYNLLTLNAFLVAGIVEFITRDGAGFTFAAFIFYGIFHLLRTIAHLIKLEQDDERANRN